MIPFGRIGLGDGHKVVAEEDASHAFDGEKPRRKGRWPGGIGGRKIRRPGVEHSSARQEFQRRRVGRGFGLDEHVSGTS